MHRLLAVARWMCWIALSSLSIQAQDTATLTKEELTAVKGQVEAALATLQPGKEPPSATSVVLPGARHVLWGTLFGDGHIYALSEVTDTRIGMAYAEWEQNRWVFREAWPAHTVWQTNPYPRTPDDGLPFDPSLCRYILTHAERDHPPALTIPYDNGNRNRRVGYHIAIYSPTQHRLMLTGIQSELGRPFFLSGYLLTCDGSDGRFGSSGMSYYRISGDKVEWCAGWFSEDARGPGDPYGIDYTAIVPGSQSGSKKEYQIRPVSQDNPVNHFQVFHDGKKLGDIRLTLPHETSPPPGSTLDSGASILWLFERFTGLPASSFNLEEIGEDSPSSVLVPLVRKLHAEVTGTDEIMKLLPLQKR